MRTSEETIKGFYLSEDGEWIPDGWSCSTIIECASDEPYSTQIGPFGNKIKAEVYTLEGAPVLRGVNVNSDRRFHDSDFVYIDHTTRQKMSG